MKLSMNATNRRSLLNEPELEDVEKKSSSSWKISTLRRLMLDAKKA